jgi:hypothetical protein
VCLEFAPSRQSGRPSTRPRSEMIKSTRWVSRMPSTLSYCSRTCRPKNFR